MPRFALRLSAFCLAAVTSLPLVAQQGPTLPVQSGLVVSSAEVHRMFLEDQAGREGTLSKEQSVALVERDTVRRLAVRGLIDRNALHTAEDFEDAAFIFQHGSSADDYLLAHTLAIVAVAKGRASALWIVTATLDRYLEKIGQPQIYGTQSQRVPPGPWTQEPYNRSLIPGGMLEVLGVESRAGQQKRLDLYNAAK